MSRMVALTEQLMSPETIMALRVLAAGNGGRRGQFAVQHFSIETMAGPDMPLEEARVYLTVTPIVAPASYSLLSARTYSVGEMVAMFQKARIKKSDLERLLEHCRDATKRIFCEEGVWKIKDYGPDNNQTITFQEFLERC